VREKRGLVYTVYAMIHSLRDRGAILAYAGTTAERAQATLDVMLAELNGLYDGITADEIDRLKGRIKRALIIQQESSPSRAGSIAFSPDSGRIAIARHDARDANTPMKLYLENVSRTVSVIDTPSFRAKTVVEQDLRRGNQGPAFNLFGYAGNSLAFITDNDLAL